MKRISDRQIKYFKLFGTELKALEERSTPSIERITIALQRMYQKRSRELIDRYLHLLLYKLISTKVTYNTVYSRACAISGFSSFCDLIKYSINQSTIWHYAIDFLFIEGIRGFINLFETPENVLENSVPFNQTVSLRFTYKVYEKNYEGQDALQYLLSGIARTDCSKGINGLGFNPGFALRALISAGANLLESLQCKESEAGFQKIMRMKGCFLGSQIISGIFTGNSSEDNFVKLWCEKKAFMIVLRKFEMIVGKSPQDANKANALRVVYDKEFLDPFKKVRKPVRDALLHEYNLLHPKAHKTIDNFRFADYLKIPVCPLVYCIASSEHSFLNSSDLQSIWESAMSIGIDLAPDSENMKKLLFEAIKMRDIKLFRILFYSHKVDLSCRDVDKSTILMRITTLPEPSCFLSVFYDSDLTKDKSYINAKDENDRTALIYAAMNKSDMCIRLLAQCNAKHSIKDVFGKTAFDYANEVQNLTFKQIFDEEYKKGYKKIVGNSIKTVVSAFKGISLKSKHSNKDNMGGKEKDM